MGDEEPHMTWSCLKNSEDEICAIILKEGEKIFSTHNVCLKTILKEIVK